ncbi:L-serine dehydratase [Kineosphaera limosa]|nr:L-serine dehydratase [Kineosphaera limosa]
MTLSALDLFSVGIGPSSSHTVGPMRAARRFVVELEVAGLLERVARVQVDLLGSLGATGRGHASDKAVILGLMGATPESVDTDTADERVAMATDLGVIALLGTRAIDFERSRDVVLHLRGRLEGHPNGMTCAAFDAEGHVLLERTFFSIGGGFVLSQEEFAAAQENGGAAATDEVELPYPFANAAQLLDQCARHDLSISDVMLANESALRPAAATRAALLNIWSVMRDCVDRGCHRDAGELPGGLRVRRRAPQLFDVLRERDGLVGQAATPESAPAAEGLQAGAAVATRRALDPLAPLDWVGLYALAVNEENASGGRIVTAPTNGAAGIIPAVLHYYVNFVPDADEEGVVRFLLTAAAIGTLFKRNASISGAEVGCQGEVGSACSMAAGALCEVLGGTPQQVENAAEIGIEHNLGLTCDPVGGLVQIPCIERNAVASAKAINAARMSLHGDGSHYVSLDVAIETMRRTGADMREEYKETSRGGLAVSVVAC